MKKQANRLIALLLTFSMALSMLSTAAWAANVDDLPLNTEAAATEPNTSEEDSSEEEPAVEEPSDSSEQENQESSETDSEDSSETAPTEEVPEEESTPETPLEEIPEEEIIPEDSSAPIEEEPEDAVTTYSVEEVEKAIINAVFLSDDTVVDVSAYSVPVEDMNQMTDKVLEEGSASDLVTVTYSTDEAGNAATMVVETDPAVEAVKDELETMNAEDGSLTEEEKQQILYLYNQYLTHCNENVQYLGVLAPYFTSKETDSELGPLGSMLIIAGHSVEDVEKGNYTFDEVMGTIQTFYYGNVFGIQYYGKQLLDTKDDALKAVKDSSAKTEIDKLLVLNDWLAHNCNFDMAYIMNASQEEPMIIAEEPTENPHRSEIVQFFYDQLIDSYKEQYGDHAETYAQMAAAQMADAVIDYWTGNQFGSLCLGKAVCMGYSSAYSYLIQWLHPEVYGVNGADTDLSKAENWKSRDDLYYVTREVEQKDENGNVITDQDGNPVTVTEKTFSTDAPYLVDFVRITFESDVRMYGEIVPNFGSDHYWNAVKVDGKWYYIDTTYTDVYMECMSRDRVETDGNMNHMYFMFSDTTTRKLYSGYYVGLDTLYEGIATDESYEDAWFAFAKSNVYTKDGNYYYFYNSTDLIGLLKKYDSNSTSDIAPMYDYSDMVGDITYALVYHDGSKGNNDSSYTELVNFNNGTALDPKSGSMVEVPLLKELYAQFSEETYNYPSIVISSALYGNRFYFNLSNCILYYDLTTGEIVKVKEYNTVSAKRDKTIPFGGMAFRVVDNDSDDVDATVTNAPIAAMTIKEDGKMYISIATNYAFISGKSNINDKNSYGYEFQETNYNKDYAGFNKKFSFGDEEINDNDEFMWSGNFVDTIAMDHLEGSSHSYHQVTVSPYCGKDGFTEERCETCGKIKADSRVADEGTALNHHYIKFDETYYTRVDEDDDTSAFNTGTSYVCTICLDAAEETDKDWDASIKENAGHDYAVSEDSVTWAEDNSYATIQDMHCGVCSGKAMDCVLLDDTVTVKDANVTCTADQPVVTGTCDQGLTTTYTATGEYNGRPCTVTKQETTPATSHDYGADGVCKRCGATGGKPAASAPAAPKLKSIANTTSGVTIKWSKSDSASGYLIFRKTGNGGWQRIKFIQSADTTAYTDSKAEAGKTVSYTVRAYAGDKAEADKKENRYKAPYWSGYDKTGLTIDRLKTPSLSTPVNASSGVTVKWGKVAGADGYRVYRKNSSGKWEKVKTVQGNSTVSWTDKNVTNGSKYVYTVRAYSKTGGSTYWSSYVSAGKTTYRLSSPSISSLKNGSSKKMTVKWGKNSKATGYQVQYATKSDFSNKTTETIKKNSTTSKTISKLTKKKKYYVRVRSYKTVNSKNYYSGWSSVKNVTIKK